MKTVSSSIIHSVDKLVEGVLEGGSVIKPLEENRVYGYGVRLRTDTALEGADSWIRHLYGVSEILSGTLDLEMNSHGSYGWDCQG